MQAEGPDVGSILTIWDDVSEPGNIPVFLKGAILKRDLPGTWMMRSRL